MMYGAHTNSLGLVDIPQVMNNGLVKSFEKSSMHIMEWDRFVAERVQSSINIIFM